MLRVILLIIRVCLFLATLFTISIYRTALIASMRGELALIIMGLLIADTIFCLAIHFTGRSGRGKRSVGLSIFLGSTLLLSLTLFVTVELVFRHSEGGVERATDEELTTLGQHFIVGFRDINELKSLVERGAIGGVYFTKRNFRGKTPVQVAEEIELLQQMRRMRGELPLIICADQEGGIVSHLSPPLTKRPPMAELAEAKGRKRSLILRDIYRYGLEQGRELNELGVNLNFSPVVDLKTAPLKHDKYSQIYYRALSGDPQLVAEGGLAYCRGLADGGVGATLKHFPGLGRATEDSHFFAPRISAAREELAATDWLPFREISAHRELPLAIMVGHTVVTALDEHNPASLSAPVVKGLLRNEWGYEGLIVTDDFSMFPISLSKEGLGAAVEKALGNGVDYILLSYDHELYYYAMSSLISSYRKGKVDKAALARSKERMREFFHK